MSHVDINYSELQEPEKSAKALKDIKEWFGSRAIHDLELYVKDGATIEQFRFMCSFGGVSGFPVDVLYNSFKETHSTI